MNAIQTATAGILSASQRFDKAASNTVRNMTEGKDIVSDLVEQIDSRNAFRASISVFETADEMLGRVLDIKT